MTSSNQSPISQLETVPECILVVDDEVLIRFALADYLRECGYSVLEAANAAEALELLQANIGAIDLVFSDVQMPGDMDGFGLAQWVRANRPGVPVILTSGNAKTADLAEELCEIGPLEAKPYHAGTLVQRMQELIATSRLRLDPLGGRPIPPEA